MCFLSTAYQTQRTRILCNLAVVTCPELSWRLDVPLFDENRHQKAVQKVAARVKVSLMTCQRDSDGQFMVNAKALAYRTEATLQQSSTLFCVLPLSLQAQQLKLDLLFGRFVTPVIPIKVKVAWTVKPNSFRRLSRLNWPSCSECAFAWLLGWWNLLGRVLSLIYVLVHATFVYIILLIIGTLVILALVTECESKNFPEEHQTCGFEN